MPSSKFTAKDVYDIVSKIPKGRLSTYGAVAEALHAKGASRAVGQILKANPMPLEIPCHRIVRSDGRVGGYRGASGSSKKTELLRSEGIKVRDGRVINLETLLLKEFTQKVR